MNIELSAACLTCLVIYIILTIAIIVTPGLMYQPYIAITYFLSGVGFIFYGNKCFDRLR